MVDCFVTTNNKRPYFLELVRKALRLSGFCPIIVEKPLLERYFECEQLAKTPIYLMCDDDCLPATESTLKELVSLMEKHPDLSQLGLGWKKDMSSEAKSTWCLGEIDEDILEFYSCGGIQAIRKGTIKDLGIKPEFPSGYGDDRVMGQVARELGFKVGVTKHLYFYNLGVHDNLSV